MLKFTVDNISGSRLPLFIDGKWREPASGKYFASYNPTTGQPWYEAALADETDVAMATQAAERAMRSGEWRKLPATAKGEYLFTLAGLISQHADELALIETQDNGKLLKETTAQIRQLARYYRYFGGAADKFGGETYQIDKSEILNFSLREPIGVVGSIVPWNSPLYMMSCSVAPALASGCGVVVKPSEHTSASAIAFADLVHQAGLPAGLFNVVTGPGTLTGAALTRDPRVAKVAFTGGTGTGVKIAHAAAERLIPLNLELGGKSPHVVFADADLDRAANGVCAGIFAAGGQTCVAGSRCFVERSVHDELLDRIQTTANSIAIGDPMSAETQLGPLALRAQLEKVQYYIDAARQDGAKVVVAETPDLPDELASGWFSGPVIITGVSNNMRVAQEEIFGPVLSIIPFDNEADMIREANTTDYGLASGIWTSDIDKAMRFAHQIDAGTVWINTYRTASFVSPMGGFKQSGYGKHHGLEALREYTRLKNVMVDFSGKKQEAFVMRVG